MLQQAANMPKGLFTVLFAAIGGVTGAVITVATGGVGAPIAAAIVPATAAIGSVVDHVIDD
jgi:hypothetical protein